VPILPWHTLWEGVNAIEVLLLIEFVPRYLSKVVMYSTPTHGGGFTGQYSNMLKRSEVKTTYGVVSKKSLKITKGGFRSHKLKKNRNTREKKTKGQTINYKTLHRKLKFE